MIDDVIEDLELGLAARGNTVLGAPVYDPRMMLKVLFYGYIRGVRSSRKLAAECRENILVIHLCVGATPDFRTICRFRVDEVQKNTYEAVDAVDGDSCYFNAGQIRRLEDDGKDVCVADSETVSAMRKGMLGEFLDGKRFRYDKARDVFACPLGNEHVFKRVCVRKDGRYFRVYEAQRTCDGCPGRQDCLGQSRNRFHKLERTLEHPWLHKYRERFLRPGYQERLRGRKLIEHNFGHLKHNLGLRRFNLRGLSGARIETFLAAFASVLRRVCNILARTGRNLGCLMRTRMAAAPTAA